MSDNEPMARRSHISVAVLDSRLFDPPRCRSLSRRQDELLGGIEREPDLVGVGNTHTLELVAR